MQLEHPLLLLDKDKSSEWEGLSSGGIPLPRVPLASSGGGSRPATKTLSLSGLQRNAHLRMHMGGEASSGQMPLRHKLRANRNTQLLDDQSNGPGCAAISQDFTIHHNHSSSSSLSAVDDTVSSTAAAMQRLSITDHRNQHPSSSSKLLSQSSPGGAAALTNLLIIGSSEPLPSIDFLANVDSAYGDGNDAGPPQLQQQHSSTSGAQSSSTSMHQSSAAGGVGPGRGASNGSISSKGVGGDGIYVGSSGGLRHMKKPLPPIVSGSPGLIAMPRNLYPLVAAAHAEQPTGGDGDGDEGRQGGDEGNNRDGELNM